MVQGHINLREFTFLYVTSHIYLSMLLHFTSTDYFSFAFMTNILYFGCLLFYYTYKIGWKIAEKINELTNNVLINNS